MKQRRWIQMKMHRPLREKNIKPLSSPYYSNRTLIKPNLLKTSKLRVRLGSPTTDAQDSQDSCTWPLVEKEDSITSLSILLLHSTMNTQNEYKGTLVSSWSIGNIFSDLVNQFLDYPTSKELWKGIETLYDSWTLLCLWPNQTIWGEILPYNS